MPLIEYIIKYQKKNLISTSHLHVCHVHPHPQEEVLFSIQPAVLGPVTGLSATISIPPDFPVVAQWWLFQENPEVYQDWSLELLEDDQRLQSYTLTEHHACQAGGCSV